MRKIFGRIQMGTECVPVEVMAIAGGYAMVRRKGRAPFIVDFSELKDVK